MRTVTCDRCGETLKNPHAPPTVLVKTPGGKYIEADLCGACTAKLYTDMVQTIEGWKPERGAA